MTVELVFALLGVAAVVVYVVATVRHYLKKSRQQWRQVDRSKLKKWDDDDDW